MRSGRITDNPEVISSPVGLVPANALVSIDGVGLGLSTIHPQQSWVLSNMQGLGAVVTPQAASKLFSPSTKIFVDNTKSFVVASFS
jgi:hypothetical protein